MKIALSIVGIVAAAAPAHGEVVSSASNGFHIRHSVTVPVAPDNAYAAFARIERWWNPQHSYSGEAARLSLKLAPGGCFCETLVNGAVEHMRVSYFEAPRRLVLSGALGPLLNEAVVGVMDLRFEAAGTGTMVTMTYKAAGFAAGGADKIAAPVDKVLGEQLSRYAASVGSR